MENSSEEKSKSWLASYAKDWKIFIDTCSLLSDNINKLMLNLIPLLQENNNKLFVPLRCVQELEKFIPDKSNITRSKKAKYIHDILLKLYKEGIVDIRGEKTDNFADNVFQTVFTKFRMQYKLLLITQDNNLASDIINLNKIKAVRANQVTALRLNKYGYLSPFHWDEYDAETGKYSPERFELCTKLTMVSASVTPVKEIPKENSIVKTDKGLIRLEGKLASGGEGIIYCTNTPFVAKIYNQEKITDRKHKKLQLMLSKKFECEGICYPVEIIYNQYEQFVGYLMPAAKGKELQKCLFIPPLFKKTFPTWKKRDVVELAITILKKIKYLNARNIIMGDINPMNILVVSTKEVYFVDTDSYQIQDYPCPVGTTNYTAPEIQGCRFTDFLRTMGHENFAIATLLFMLMLPGKPPYSQQGGVNPAQNIKNMDFSYPFGDNSNKKTPDGPWRFMWSHLTYAIKKAFYNTFMKGGEYANENNRLNVDKWLGLFEEYLNLLDSGKFGQQDKMSEELFPTRFKKNPNATYIKCKLCGVETEERLTQGGMCKKCQNDGEHYRCSRCGSELIFTNYLKYVKMAKRRELCADCFEWGNQTALSLNCTDCGKMFQISNSEKAFLNSKGFVLPHRCKTCREEKKNRGW